MGSGVVVDDGQFQPAGVFSINCTVTAGVTTGTCSRSFQDPGGGGVVSVVATANPGTPSSRFIGWTGDCTSIVGGLGQTCAMSFPAGVTDSFRVVATFDLSPGVVTVRVDGTGAGTGRVTGTGGALPSNLFTIDCTVTAGVESGTCQDTFDTGTAGGTVSLTVTVFPPNTFGGWGTGCSSISGSTCSLTFTPFETRAFNLAPRFDLPSLVPGTITVVVDGTGNGVGTVQDDGTVTPAGSFVINCLIQAGGESGPCQDSFDHVGAGSVSLIATPSPGSTLISWSGCPVVNGGTCTLDFGVSETRTFTLAPRFDPPTELIAFVSDRDGNFEIYTVTTDGATVQRLTDNPAVDGAPSFSRNGQQVLFNSERDGDLEIYRMDRDGTAVRRLTNDPAADESPAFSRDGTQVVFMSDRTSRGGLPAVELWIMSADDGTALRQLTFTAGDDYGPSWSPVEDLIVFSSIAGNALNDEEIYTIAADGTGMNRLTNNQAQDHETSWSPDGTMIAFISDRTGSGDVYVMDRNGGNVRQITFTTGAEHWPTWSPDGTKIAYSIEESGTQHIYIRNADGTGLATQLMTDSGGHPSWGKAP